MSGAHLVALLLVLVTLATCILAFWRGGLAERLTGGLILASIPLSLALQAVPASHRALAQLGIDALIALVMLILAVVSASRWLGAVMLLYAAQFTLHAYYVVMSLEPDALFVIINNSVFLLITLTLLMAVVSRMRGRHEPELAAA